MRDELRIVPMDETNYTDAARLARENLREGWSEKTYEEQLKNPSDRTYIAYFGEQACGFLSAWYVLDEIEINNVAVEKDFRRLGIGRKLFERLFEDLPEAERTVLEVRESNAAAIGLYKSLGFVQAGIRKGLYSHPDENGLVMIREKG